MSTRASIIYTDAVHLYEELLDSWVYLDVVMQAKNGNTVDLSLPIMPAEEFYKQIREKYGKEAEYWRRKYEDALAVNQQLVAKMEDK